MGSSLGCVVANIYMRFSEEMALQTAVTLGISYPHFWIRDVDDILVVFKQEERHLREFLVFLNSLRPAIQFTLELESEGSSFSGYSCREEGLWTLLFCSQETHLN